MMAWTTADRQALARCVLFVLGAIDLVRGALHTFFVNWAARKFARLDLTTARGDQLTLLGAFGVSNLLTGAIFLLVSLRAAALAADVLLAIPCAYLLGGLGMRVASVRRQSAFYGRYFMLAYLGVCAVVFALTRF